VKHPLKRVKRPVGGCNILGSKRPWDETFGEWANVKGAKRP